MSSSLLLSVSVLCMWQVMTREDDQQAAEGLRADKFRNLSQRLDAAAGKGADEVGGHIKSHPDVQVTTLACRRC